LFTTDSRQVRKKRNVAAVPLTSEASSSVRTLPSRRAQFPPLQFVNDVARTAAKPYITRSRVSNIQSFVSANHTSVARFQSNCDNKVADSDLCSGLLEQQDQAESTEPAEYLQLTKQLTITADGECLVPADCMNSCRDEVTSCNPVCCKAADDPTGSNHMSDGRMLSENDEDLTVPEKSKSISQEQDLTVCAENISAVHFDINTATCEVETCESEPLVCIEYPQKVVNRVETETETCQNMSGLADRNSLEPVHVLCFSRIDHSVDETQDPVESFICAAELNAHMSELHDGDGESSVNVCVNSHQSFCHYRPELFSTVNALTPFDNHCKNTVLVSDTPVSDYGLSYRQRALKAASIRLRHRTHKS